MGTVKVMCYWGGTIVQDPDEGISYDTEAKGFYTIQRRTTLQELEEFLMPKVVDEGETIRLKLICRHPHRQWERFIYYRKVPINDDMTLDSVLDIPPCFPTLNYVELYVEKENVTSGLNAPEPMCTGYGAYSVEGSGSQYGGMYNSLFNQGAYSGIGGSFTGMLTQDSYATASQYAEMSPEPYYPRYEGFTVGGSQVQHDIGTSSGVHRLSPLHLSTSPVDRFHPPVDEYVTLGGDGGDGCVPDSAGPDLDVDADIDAELMVDEESDDEGQEFGEPSSPSVDIPEQYTPIPFFTNLEGGGDATITSRDLYSLGNVWTPETVEFKKGMIFKDKESVKYAVKMYNVKKNKQYVVVETGKKVWDVRCKHDCSWRFRASKKEKHGFFEIKTYPGPHHCLFARLQRDHCNIDTDLITTVILDSIKVNYCSFEAMQF